METPVKQKPLLVLLPSVRITQNKDGNRFITQKFIDGVKLYKQLWPGDINVLVENAYSQDENLDPVNIDNISEFKLTIINLDNIEPLIASFHKNTVLLASIHYRQNNIASLCLKYGIKCVQTSEYTLQTRLQITRANKSNLLKRWRTYLWEFFQEQKNKQSVRQSSGVQCNGTPTYLAYKHINNNCLLYFDSRVHKKNTISKNLLNQRTAQCLQGKPLRLLFSGRLNTMKGADHLILFARALNDLKVDFKLTICGDGELAEPMKKQINELNLNNRVVMAGVLNFQSELLPLVQNSIDLFICCHRQGDPSCTYLETMSCGVPIVGYNNEAFSGLNEIIDCGWGIPTNHYQQLAKKVQSLDNNRQEIVQHSIRAREFSLKHTFENTFEKRIEHLLKLVH